MLADDASLRNLFKKANDNDTKEFDCHLFEGLFD